MTWRDLFSACWWSHADPIKVVRGKLLSFECERCGADLGPVLPGQKFRGRKTKPLKLKAVAPVVPFKKASRG
jgi:hypothetical protein